MAITFVSLGIGIRKFDELGKAGIPMFNQDWEEANALRRTQMLKVNKHEVRDGIGDTGNKVLEHYSKPTFAVCGSELVEKLLTSSHGAVVYLKVRDRKGQKSYFLIVREVEVGFDEPTNLNADALNMIKKAAKKWFKNVVVWSNPDATITVNLFQNQSPEEFEATEEVKQVRFVDDKPTLV